MKNFYPLIDAMKSGALCKECTAQFHPNITMITIFTVG